MQYLSLALYAEGPTDYYFLRPLLYRLCEDLCLRNGMGAVDISEVLGLDHPPADHAASRAQRILSAAQSAQGAWRVLFIHADGANDPRHLHAEQVEPALSLLRKEFGAEGIGVAVVPVRETESWAIADGEALRHAFGSGLSDAELGLPSLARVAAVTDPKALLEAAFELTQPSGRRKRQGTSPYLNALGEQVSLPRLRQLEAFAAMEAELKDALQQLNILR